METTTKKNGAAKIETAEVKTYQTIAFKPRPTLLLDVLPEGDFQTESIKPGEQTAGQDAGGRAGDDPQEMLGTLLRNAETCALRTQRAKMRWQLAVLVMGTLLVPAGLLIGLMTYEKNIGVTQKGRLEMENQTLKSRVNSAGVQIDGLKREIENLKKRNAESSVAPRSFATVAAPAASINEEQKPTENNRQQAAAAGQVIDMGRVEAIKKGKYPMGASKTELMAVLGQPDRTYAARNYEQLLYFGQKPGRFWFIGGYLVQASE